MAIQLGYCTNVHAGSTLAETRANLERFAVAVKRRFSPAEPMGIGLWLSASSARHLLRDGELERFANWLGEAGLIPFTLNGFPFGDFHSPIVKHDVYLPTWWEPARLAYTRDLIAIQDALLPPGMFGSISTLPIAWPEPQPQRAQLARAGQFLRTIGEVLLLLESQCGRRLMLCVEPEPGCVLQRARDIVRFFEDYVFNGSNDRVLRRYLGVCHDICHAAVMFEEQADVLRLYRAAGLEVGKVQVSSAVAMRLDPQDEKQRQAALTQMGGFVEERYLHQTMVRMHAEAEPAFYEDLPLARAIAPAPTSGEWRVHFHVPIYLDQFGALHATRSAILECLKELVSDGGTQHYEVETYAWGVLPAELRQPDLAAGIAAELRWFVDTIGEFDKATLRSS